MTKLNSGKMVVIKINGERRSFSEETNKPEMESVENAQPETTPEPALPVVKNDAHTETAASKELSDDVFDWILPEAEEVQGETSRLEPSGDEQYFPKIKIKQAGAVKKMIFAVVLAVLVGTSLGMIMLKLVSLDELKQAASSLPGFFINNKKATPASASVPAVTLKPWIAYVVQGGVYSSKESANTVVSQAATIGIPADLIEMGGMQFVMIGVANSLEEAKSLGSYLQEKGFTDVYPRSLAIPEKKLTGLNSDEAAFIKDAAALFPILTSSTAAQGNSGPLPNETMNAITTLEGNMAKISSKNLANGKLRNLQKDITQAADQVKAYQATNDSSKLAEAQQDLLNFLTNYYSL